MTADETALVDILVEDKRWDSLEINQIAETAVKAALGVVGIDPQDCEISLLACDDTKITKLNAGFRGLAKPTNVLSWPAADLSPATPGDPPRTAPSGFLGDIAIAYETTAREAEAAGLALEDHVTHLLVHAVLHLLGYDHETDADAALMEGLEIKALARLGIGNPYLND